MPGFASLLAASAAVRVASLNMCADEYLLLLARPAEIASVSRLSRDPADSSLWQLGQRYPGNRGDLESALKTRPNVVLTMGGGGRSTTVIAGRMGLRTIDMGKGRSTVFRPKRLAMTVVERPPPPMVSTRLGRDLSALSRSPRLPG